MLRFGIALSLIFLWLGATVRPGAALPSPRLVGNACAWHLVSAPSTTFDGNDLLDVRATSSTDAWAVGEVNDDFSGDYFPLTEHYNGTAWSIVNSPQPLNTYVSSVREISPTDVWAVGGSQNQSTFVDQTFTEHWNGSSWTVIPSPNVGSQSNDLVQLAYSTTNDVWAFGYYFDTTANAYLTLTLHWNGSSWSVVPSPDVSGANNFLRGGGALRSTNVWAVGYAQGTGSPAALAEHWNGALWSVVPTPSIGYSIFNSFVPVTNRSSWAIGYAFNGTHQITLAEHWNGSSFSVVPTPDVSGADTVINAAAAVSATDVWAVGNTFPTERTFTMNWNGSSWTAVTSPNRGSIQDDLDGIGRIPGTSDVWAVGRYFRNSLQNNVLVMKFHC